MSNTHWKTVGLGILGIAIAVAGVIFAANHRSSSTNNIRRDEPEVDNDNLRYGELGYNAIGEVIDNQNRQRISQGLHWSDEIHEAEDAEFTPHVPFSDREGDIDMYDENGERIW